MEIGRRELLAGAASLGLAGMVGPVKAGHAGDGHPVVPGRDWHPLTRLLLDRTGRAGRRPDRARVEGIIHEVAGAHGRPVIKWIQSPSRAFDHLRRFSLGELLRMEPARLWPSPPRLPIGDEGAVEQSIELYLHAVDLLGVEEHGRALTAPKLEFKSRAIASESRPEAAFEARAITAEIGWIETSMPAAAARAVRAVEDLLSAGHAKASEEIHHQLLAFDAFEHGLLATWETPDELVCVPVGSVEGH